MTGLDEAARQRHATGLPPIRKHDGVMVPVHPDHERAPDATEVDTGQDVDAHLDDPIEGVIVTEPPARAPLIPDWARDRTTLLERLWHVAREVAYTSAYHLLHTPAYYLRLARYAPSGLVRIIRAAWRWAYDMETNPEMREALTRHDVDGYMKLAKETDLHQRHRIPVLWGGLAATLGGVGAAWSLLSWPTLTVTGAAVLPILGWVGYPPDRPITDTVTARIKWTKLTGEMVRLALVDMGVGIKDPDALDFDQEIHRDGPGMLAVVSLPRGVLATKVCAEKPKLSSALRLPPDQVWPSVGSDHDGQLLLWVGYQPASKMKSPTWSITLDGAVTSVFEPVEFAYDAQMVPISVKLFERNFLIGGQPGSGKTYMARALLLAASLDPTAEFKIAEFKGTGDFIDFERLCSDGDYYCGLDDEAFDGGRRIVEFALAEAARRAKKIKRFKREGRAPEGKVTPELAAAGVGLHPLVIGIDEGHELILEDPEVGGVLERIIKRGRALNIIIVLATQIPDKHSLPPNITRCTNTRIALSLDGHVENDMILGSGAYKAGWTATEFRPGKDAGWAIVKGLEQPTRCRSHFPADAESKKILARALELRGGQSVASEQAERVEILVEVLRVWPTGRSGMHWGPLAEELAKKRPELYGDLSGESLSALLRGLDVPSQDVKAGGTVRKGCRREAIEAAAERRELVRG